ncbi:Ger(x)C family spore germination protein [Bacillus sp. B-jedd]|uniref:Ger(x)C family spore germination protein n=1 Tax=Bacillus sp. B-jedd TaxID=1476857 RepID=UPI0005156E9F|nr:Ger(x)C family spore germination protein [Bacillus sp. B-jedd]CEG25809.1 spore germination B3 GerAC family protein [Bacillus sp. B-jedd]
MNRTVLIAIVLLFLPLSACGRTKTIDQLSILHTVGYDSLEGGELRGTLLYPDYTKSKNEDNIQIRKTRGKTSSMLLARTNKQTKNPIELSKIQVIAFGEDYARHGIGHLIDTVFNNPMIATDIQTVVVTPTARKYLEGVKKNGTLAIDDTIVQNYTTSSMPRTSLHIFMNDYYGEGRDPYMPILKQGAETNVYVDGLAIFKDDKFKVRLDNNQAFIFGLLDNFNHQGFYELPIKIGSHTGDIVIRTMKNKPAWRPGKSNRSRSLELSLNLFVIIREYPDWVHLHNEKDIHLLEKTIEKKVKSEITSLIKTFKENGVDPLGLGDRIRAYNRNWNERTFYKDEYKKLQVKIDVKTTVIQAGIKR